MITLAPPPPAERTDELAAGARLGDCTIAETLHRGADATVYSAWVSGRDRIALKVLDREAARNPRRLRSFYVAAKLAMLLNHPRLASVHMVGEAEGRHYQSMPLFEQPTLQQQLWGQRPLAEPAVWRFALGLAEGLELLHRAGFVHRDVGTATIFTHETLGWVLGASGWLLDQTTTDDLTAPEGVSHWHPFQAPELLLGQARRAGPACDCYSLAAVMAKCLLGTIPFETRTRDECLAAKRQQSSLWLSEAGGALSRETARFLAQCLDRDPARRPQSLVEFASQGARVLGQPLETVWPRLGSLPRGGTEGTWHAWKMRNGEKQLEPIPHARVEYLILRGQWGPRTLVSCNPRGPFLPLGQIPEFRHLLELAGE